MGKFLQQFGRGRINPVNILQDNQHAAAGALRGTGHRHQTIAQQRVQSALAILRLQALGEVICWQRQPQQRPKQRRGCNPFRCPLRHQSCQIAALARERCARVKRKERPPNRLPDEVRTARAGRLTRAAVADHAALLRQPHNFRDQT